MYNKDNISYLKNNNFTPKLKFLMFIVVRLVHPENILEMVAKLFPPIPDKSILVSLFNPINIPAESTNIADIEISLLVFI